MAIGIIISFVVSFVTIIVLIRTLLAVNRQVGAANRQAEAATDQAAAARAQIGVLEQQRTAAERAAQAAEEQARAARSATEVAEAQRIAAEQAVQAARIQSELTRHEILARLRPILVIASHANPNPNYPDLLYAENHGQGVALDVKVIPTGSVIAGTAGILHNILGPGQKSLLGTDSATIKREGVKAYYQSEDGRRFVTVVEPSEDSFLKQNTFEINEKGGWLPQPEIPSAS
ncbi:MAG: hypothetical protein WB676_09140 [Bryobacteraceae bacterium]